MWIKLYTQNFSLNLSKKLFGMKYEIIIACMLNPKGFNTLNN